MTFAPPPASTWELYHKLKVHPNWGYVIYRTTYSPQSDAQFSTAVKYIEASVKKSLFGECAYKNESPPGVNPAIYEEIWAKHSLTVIEDAALFDGASTDSIRAHFEAWVDTQGQRDSFNRYRMCIVIDEECLQTLLGTSVEALEQETEYKRQNKALCEDDTYEGYELPKETIVFINARAIHINESEYDEPAQFMPERFIGNKFGCKDRDDSDDHRRKTYTFGAGRRIYPGQRLAEARW
ncbi:hypothetical protein N7504_009030 [Penicillium tannophilum]|nr:hypothetical protein N7504_009030 [Penicillium tannophilum]